MQGMAYRLRHKLSGFTFLELAISAALFAAFSLTILPEQARETDDLVLISMINDVNHHISILQAACTRDPINCWNPGDANTTATDYSVTGLATAGFGEVNPSDIGFSGPAGRPLEIGNKQAFGNTLYDFNAVAINERVLLLSYSVVSEIAEDLAEALPSTAIHFINNVTGFTTLRTRVPRLADSAEHILFFPLNASRAMLGDLDLGNNFLSETRHVSVNVTDSWANTANDPATATSLIECPMVTEAQLLSVGSNRRLHFLDGLFGLNGNTVGNQRCKAMRWLPGVDSSDVPQPFGFMGRSRKGVSEDSLNDASGIRELQIAGDVHVGWSVWSSAFLLYSDERIKSDIKEINAERAQDLLRLKTVRYKDRAGLYDVGFLAQDVRKYFPELVFNDGPSLTVDYSAIVPLLGENIRIQQDRLDTISKLLETKPSSNQKSNISDLESDSPTGAF